MCDGHRRFWVLSMMLRLFLPLIFVWIGVGAVHAENKAASDVNLENAGSPKPASYIGLKPRNGVYDIVVMGDSLANGLHQGLTQLNKDNPGLKTARKSKVNTGLVRVDRYDWNKGAKKIARTGKYQVAVVLLGLNDLQSIREKGKAHHFQTDGWVERYKDRTERMMRDLRDAGIAVYWTSIPITTRYQKEYEYLNGFYKQAAAKTGVRFIDTWSALADPEGNYSAYWKDEQGKQLEIRARDGVHFTPFGYQIFAGIVNDALQQDLAVAAGTAISR